MIYDFIVVGAGAAGASAAFELARLGRVCIVEREPVPGFHATGRSAALFAPSYGGSEIRALTRASRAFLDMPPSGFSEQPLLKSRGCLYIARSDQCDLMQEMVVQVRQSGGKIDEIGADEAERLIPLLRPGYVAAAIFDRGAMDMDVEALHQGFLRQARGRGADLLTGATFDQPRRREGLWLLDINGSEVSAPVVINAAGAWADAVAGKFGANPVGLTPLRRTAIIVDPPTEIDVTEWPTVMDVAESFYFKPDAGRLLLSPADETPSPAEDAHPTELDVAIGVDRVQMALNLEVRRVRKSWAGLRTFAPDRVPVVGFDPQVTGFFWCAGQGGYGIQTAPAMGRLTAELAAGHGLPLDLKKEGLEAASLSPLRFAADFLSESVSLCSRLG